MKPILIYLLLILTLKSAAQSDSSYIYAYDTLSSTLLLAYPTKDYILLESFLPPKNISDELIVQFEMFDTIQIDQSYLKSLGYEILTSKVDSIYQAKSDSTNRMVNNVWDQTSASFYIKDRFHKWPLCFSYGLASRDRRFLWIEIFERSGGLLYGGGGDGILFELSNGQYCPIRKILWQD